MRAHSEALYEGSSHILFTIQPLPFDRCDEKSCPFQVGAFLSMGYGFVQFLRKSDASNALKSLQNKSLNGHSLELKRSNRIEGANSEGEAQKAGMVTIKFQSESPSF